MRHRRSYRRRRTNNTYTWQSFYLQKKLDGPSSQGNSSFVIGYTIPGVGDGGTVSPAIRAFDAPHVLERIRGHICHDGATPAPGNEASWFPFSIAAMRIPAGVIIDTDDIPSIMNNTEGDDYFFYGSHVCGARVSNNIDQIDSKAKRRFDVGDKIAWLGNIINPFVSGFNADVDLSLNVRLLWKLGK